MRILYVTITDEPVGVAYYPNFELDDCPNESFLMVPECTIPPDYWNMDAYYGAVEHYRSIKGNRTYHWKDPGAIDPTGRDFPGMINYCHMLVR